MFARTLTAVVRKRGGGQVFSGMIILITGGPTSGEGLNHFLGWKMLQKTAC